MHIDIYIFVKDYEEGCKVTFGVILVESCT